MRPTGRVEGAGSRSGRQRDGTGDQLRQYTDDVETVRVLYFVTALRTVVVVAYIEV